MITNNDRSGWFGASDTYMIMSNWTSKSFERFWLEKCGIINQYIMSPSIMAGKVFEHRILDALGIKNRDRTIKIPKYRIRVNLDGETDVIEEVKTYKSDKFVLSKPYIQQVNVQMFAAKKNAEIISYKLTDEDYINFYNPIDIDRISFHNIRYDQDLIYNKYLPRVIYLKHCLKERKTPNMTEFEREWINHDY